MQVQETRKGYKKVKSLFGKYEEIPEEWEIKTFEELFEFLRTGTNSRSDLQDNGEIQYIHYGDIHAKWNSILDCNVEEIPFIDKSKVEKIPILKDGDLIIADASEDYEGSGASVILKNVKNRKIVSGLHTIVLRTSNESISSNFKTYLNSIKFVKNQIIGRVTGISVYGLSKNNLKTIRIPLPPLKEQQKIASILSNVDSLINQTQKEIELNKKLKKGLMQKLLTRGIGHTKFKQTQFGKIPFYWKIGIIGDYCKVGTGGTPSRNKNEYFNGDIPWVKTTEIKYNIIMDTEEKISKKALEESSAKIYSKNTVLFAMYGQGVTRGKCAILGIDAAINQACAAINPNSFLNIWFLFYWLQYYYEKIRTQSSGSHQSNFNLNQVRQLEIGIPKLDEQQKIASILSNVDSLIQNQQEYKSRLKSLKKGLMQKLLTGKIRVKV